MNKDAKLEEKKAAQLRSNDKNMKACKSRTKEKSEAASWFGWSTKSIIIKESRSTKLPKGEIFNAM